MKYTIAAILEDEGETFRSICKRNISFCDSVTLESITEEVKNYQRQSYPGCLLLGISVEVELSLQEAH